MKKEVKQYKVRQLPDAPQPDSLYWVKGNTDSDIRGFITDINGVAYPLKDITGSGGIQSITNNDGSVTITGTDDLVINISPTLLSTINSALQTETDPIFQASEASLFVAGDKANLDNQSGINNGDETTLSIQTKRPLKTINGESLEGSGNIVVGSSITNTSELINDGSDATSTYVETDELGAVAFSNDYNDLDNLPTLPVVSTLLKEEFIFSGSQTFTLTNNYAQVYSVEVQGQGALSTSQYTLVAPNQVTINDTLDTGDYVVIIYSDALSGVVPYYTQAQTDLGFIAIVPNFVYVRDVNDFPIAVSGVRTLLPDVTYFIANNIDLNGDRLVGSANTTIIGSSSENSTLTSTGLGIGIPLYYSIYTTPIRHISFKDVHTAIEFDGSTNPNDMALDWTGVNFVNVPNIGLIKDASNFIFDKGAFLNSKGMSFDGTIGTVGFGNSLFSGDGLLGDILEIESTCTITRRFRIIYSSIITFGSTDGINVSTSATIPNEGYILDTINFSGGSTYLAGVVDNGDNKTLFNNCRGIINTNPNSQYYMNGNLTTTTISSTGVAVKVSGTTSSSLTTQKFTNTNNRATYNGAISQIFKVVATLSLESGNNNQIGCYIAKNGIILPESEVYGTTNGAGRAENIVIQTKVNLSTNDYIEIFVENETAINNILVTDLNVIVD